MHEYSLPSYCFHDSITAPLTTKLTYCAIIFPPTKCDSRLLMQILNVLIHGEPFISFEYQIFTKTLSIDPAKDVQKLRDLATPWRWRPLQGSVKQLLIRHKRHQRLSRETLTSVDMWSQDRTVIIMNPLLVLAVVLLLVLYIIRVATSRPPNFPPGELYFLCFRASGFNINVIKSTIFWDITPCSPLKVNRRFGETSCLHLQGWGASQCRARGSSQCHFKTVHKEVSLSRCDSPFCDSWPDYSCSFVIVWLPLWRTDGSVIRQKSWSAIYVNDIYDFTCIYCT
jgi:hypothetical protein